MCKCHDKNGARECSWTARPHSSKTGGKSPESIFSFCGEPEWIRPGGLLLLSKTQTQTQKQYCLLHVLKEDLRWSDTENMFGFHFHLPHDLGKVTWPLWSFLSSSVKGRWAFSAPGTIPKEERIMTSSHWVARVRTKDKGIAKWWRRPAFIPSPAHLMTLLAARTR